MTDKKVINIDVVSDVICPWCWVGKRKMEEAMAETQEKYEFKIKWHPFLLRPSMPREGVPKPADTPQNPRVSQRLKQAGAAVGIDFTGKTDITPNTLQAHALLEFVLEHFGGEKQNEVAEEVFKAYFTDGQQPDTDTLVAIASSHSMNVDDVKSYITDEDVLMKIHQTASDWSDKGVTGVPKFYMNGQPMFSGAQDPSTFIKMFDIISSK